MNEKEGIQVPVMPLGILFDPARQTVTLQFDPNDYRDWDFVLAILEMARLKAEEGKKMNMIRKMAEEQATQQLIRKMRQ